MGNLDGVPKEKPAENQRVLRRERIKNDSLQYRHFQEVINQCFEV